MKILIMIVFPTLLTAVFTQDTIVFRAYRIDENYEIKCLRQYRENPKNIYLENSYYLKNDAKAENNELLVTNFFHSVKNNNSISITIQTENRDVSFFVNSTIFQVIYLFVKRTKTSLSLPCIPQLSKKISDIVCVQEQMWECLYRKEGNFDILFYPTNEPIVAIHIKNDRIIFSAFNLLFTVTKPRSRDCLAYFIQRFHEAGINDTPHGGIDSTGIRRRRRKLK
jgi:hypothetical protein